MPLEQVIVELRHARGVSLVLSHDPDQARGIALMCSLDEITGPALTSGESGRFFEELRKRAKAAGIKYLPSDNPGKLVELLIGRLTVEAFHPLLELSYGANVRVYLTDKEGIACGHYVWNDIVEIATKQPSPA